jgi:hypothetical protein
LKTTESYEDPRRTFLAKRNTETNYSESKTINEKIGKIIEKLIGKDHVSSTHTAANASDSLNATYGIGMCEQACRSRKDSQEKIENHSGPIYTTERSDFRVCIFNTAFQMPLSPIRLLGLRKVKRSKMIA